MNNNEDILKKILLHMKYDSGKTLKENEIALKRVLKESCIPANTILTQVESGKVRSEEYPELGKWGDGTCKCANTTECLEFKSECCKKPSVSVEGNVVFDYAADGRILELPQNTKILSRFNTNDMSLESVEEFKGRAPLIQQSCETNRPIKNGKYDINECLKDFKEKFIKNIKNDSVHSFMVDGKKYSSCFVIRKTVGSANQFFTVEEMKPHTGYGSPCVENKMWAKYNTDIKKPSDTNKTGNKFELDIPGATKNEYDNTTKLSFDLEL